GAYDGGIWAGLAIGNALILFFFSWHLDKKPPKPGQLWTKMAIGSLLAMACLNIVSTDPGVSWDEWTKLATIFLPLILLTGTPVTEHAYHPKFFNVLPAALTVGSAALCITLYVKSQGMTPRQIEVKLAHYNRGFSYIAILAFPAMAGIWLSKKRWLVIP